MTQPKGAQHAHALVAALRSASRVAVVMTLATVAVIGADAAVAVHRATGTSHPAASAGAVNPTPVAEPGLAVSPTAVPSSTSKQARRAAQESTAKALLAEALADALGQRTVHARTRAVYRGLGTALYDNRAAGRGGIQHLTIYGGHIAIRVIGPTTYYNADRIGLIRFLLYSPADAAAFNLRWVRLTRGQRGYAALTAGVTLASLLNEDRVSDPLRLLPERRVDGVRAVGIRGRATGGKTPRHAIATMWVRTGDHPLPVKYVQRSKRLVITQGFTGWGRRVRLAAPAAAVPE